MRIFQIRCFIGRNGVRYRPYEKVVRYKTRWFRSDKKVEVWEDFYLYTYTSKCYFNTRTGFESASQVMEALTDYFGKTGFVIEEWVPSYES